MMTFAMVIGGRVKQANLGLNAAELAARQVWLQGQAHALIAERRLVEILALAGEPVIVGSLRMGLMVWPDLDITVATAGIPDLDKALEVVPLLMKDAGARKLNIVDRRGRSEDRLPSGIYLGPDLERDGLTWQVDIWLMDEESVPERLAYTDRIMAQLTDERRRAILAIKQVAAASDVYHRGVSSTDIYSAVLEHGVATPEEFAAWLALSGRSL
jgi:hypothetical protein